MYTIENPDICNRMFETAEELLEQSKNASPPAQYARLVDYVTEWWSQRLSEINPADDPYIKSDIEHFVAALRADLCKTVSSDDFSEEKPFGIYLSTGCCGELDGSLAVYSAAANRNTFNLPDGFEPNGYEMLVTPNAIVIFGAAAYDSEERGNGYDTVVHDVIYSAYSPSIAAATLWLCDYVFFYDDDFCDYDRNADPAKGDTNVLYEVTAKRLKASLGAGTVTLRSKDFEEIFQQAQISIPVPTVSLHVSAEEAHIATPGGERTIIYQQRG